MISRFRFNLKTVLLRSKARWLKVVKWRFLSGLSTRSWKWQIHHLAYTLPIFQSYEILTHLAPGGCAWDRASRLSWCSLWWLPGNAALWPLEGEIDSTSWHCLSFVPSSKHGKKKKEGSQQRQASFPFYLFHMPLFLSFLPLLLFFLCLLPAPPHTQTHTQTGIYTSTRQHQKQQIGLLSHSGANSKMMCFWRGYNGIQCLSIWAQETCCQREYSSPLLQRSNTIAHIQHDSA